jgi:hypothetical protein
MNEVKEILTLIELLCNRNNNKIFSVSKSVCDNYSELVIDNNITTKKTTKRKFISIENEDEHDEIINKKTNEEHIYNIKNFLDKNYYGNIDSKKSEILIFYFKYLTLNPDSCKKNKSFIFNKKNCEYIIEIFKKLKIDNIDNIENNIYSEFLNVHILHSVLFCICCYFYSINNNEIYQNYCNDFKLKYPEYSNFQDNSTNLLTIKMWIIMKICKKNLKIFTKMTILNFVSTIIGIKLISGGNKSMIFSPNTKAWWINISMKLYHELLYK